MFELEGHKLGVDLMFKFFMYVNILYTNVYNNRCLKFEVFSVESLEWLEREVTLVHRWCALHLTRTIATGSRVEALHVWMDSASTHFLTFAIFQN